MIAVADQRSVRSNIKRHNHIPLMLQCGLFNLFNSNYRSGFFVHLKIQSFKNHQKPPPSINPSIHPSILKTLSNHASILLQNFQTTPQSSLKTLKPRLNPPSKLSNHASILPQNSQTTPQSSLKSFKPRLNPPSKRHSNLTFHHPPFETT